MIYSLPGTPGFRKATTKEEVDILVDDWHTMEDADFEAIGEPGLAEYLGWTEKEYSRWLEHKVIPQGG